MVTRLAEAEVQLASQQVAQSRCRYIEIIIEIDINVSRDISRPELNTFDLSIISGGKFAETPACSI
ncbi:hypothetical protein ES703_119216 [subsurface metagenome]